MVGFTHRLPRRSQSDAKQRNSLLPFSRSDQLPVQHNSHNLALVLTEPSEATQQTTHPTPFPSSAAFTAYFYLWRETEPNLRLRHVLGFPNHFINAPSDWLKPGVNFYPSLLASEWAEAAKAKLPFSSADPRVLSPHQQTAMLWNAAANAGCWLLARCKNQGTIKPTESHQQIARAAFLWDTLASPLFISFTRLPSAPATVKAPSYGNHKKDIMYGKIITL